MKDRLPDELKLAISRKFSHEIWTLDVLLKYIADELLAKESCSSMFKKNNSANNESGKGRYTTSSFALGSHEVTYNRKCGYCLSESHSLPQCKKVSKGPRTRIQFLEIFSKFKYFGNILSMLHEE